VKSRIMITALFTVMSAGLVAGVAHAQDGGGPMRHHGHGAFRGQEFGLPLRQLNLTDDQRAQVRQIFQNEKTNLKPLMQQDMQSHQQMMQLVTSGSFDQAKATAIATQDAQNRVQVEVEHAKIASQIYQLLNSEQKAKLADIMAKHRQRMQEHLQKNEPAAPEQQ